MCVELPVRLISAKIKPPLGNPLKVLSFLALGKFHATLDSQATSLNLLARGTMPSYSSYEDNLGFLKRFVKWNCCTIYGLPIGNFRLYETVVITSFANYKVGDIIPVMDVSLIDGKIDIRRDGKDLLTIDLIVQFKKRCFHCSGMGRIYIGCWYCETSALHEKCDGEYIPCPECKGV